MRDGNPHVFELDGSVPYNKIWLERGSVVEVIDDYQGMGPGLRKIRLVTRYGGKYTVRGDPTQVAEECFPVLRENRVVKEMQAMLNQAQAQRQWPQPEPTIPWWKRLWRSIR